MRGSTTNYDSALKYYNYGACINGVSSTFEATLAFPSVSGTTDNSKFENELKTDTNGDLVYNKVYSPAKSKGNTNYVNPTGKFKSRLIYDGSGDIVGISFQQLKN